MEGITTIIILIATLLVLSTSLIISTSLVQAQAQAQAQQLPPQANQFLQGPSQAQIQADIARAQNSPEGKAIQHIKDEIAIAAATGNSTHLLAVLNNMTRTGLISCPLPINANHPNCLIRGYHAPGAPEPPSPLLLPPPITILPPGVLPIPPSLIAPPLIPSLIPLSQQQVLQKFQNLPPVGLPPGAMILNLPPGIPALPPPPSLSTQDMKQLQFQTQYLQKTLNEIQQRLGNDTSMAHQLQVLKQMTAEGKISCPTPLTSPVGCMIAPPGSTVTILPPQANQFLQGASPSQAQIQADIAREQNSPEGKALQHIKDEIAAAAAGGSAHLSAVLTNMTKTGLISCPLPINVQYPMCLISVPHAGPQPPYPLLLPPPNASQPQP